MSEGNGYATREQFLRPAERRYKDVELPISGLKVRIRSLMELEKEQYESETMNRKGGLRQDMLKNARRRLVVLCLSDENGSPLLTPNDVDALGKLDGVDIGVLQDECMVFCGFREGDIEGLVKNSSGVHDEDSPTD